MKTDEQKRFHPTQEDTKIAIIGVSLRFPKSNTLDEFWDHLIAEKSLISEIPPKRWDKSKFFGDPRMEANKTNSVWGGFIDDADCFDAPFFNITPREAISMDPQQRIILELAWKAIEDAGYKASSLKGSKTGVFMGVCNTDYTELIEKQLREFDAYIPTGTSYAIIANRISYWFDFKGPSLTLDTACAGSLVAIHQAVRSLENGECESALAGGVNLCWCPRRFIALSQSGMLSKDGKCKAFDEKADGYVRAEGGAVLVLKPLNKALEERDHIYAIIKGIGTNHGGRTNSLTVTNPKAQAELIAEVYEKAGVGPETVSYIETHGPGTPLGDPIEIHGLKTAFGQLAKKSGKSLKKATCGLGSVKTNIGHLESAAGIAGIMKVVAAMKHKILPASIHFDQLNPVINFEGSPFYIVNKAKPWEVPTNNNKPRFPRRAGVSSFGFGGSNAHAILEEFIPEEKSELAQMDGKVLPNSILIPLSAKNKERLWDYAGILLDFIKRLPLEKTCGAENGPDSVAPKDEASQNSSVNHERMLNNLAYTLQTAREAMEERVIFLACDFSQLYAQLEAFIQRKETIANCWWGQVKQGKELIGFLTGDEDSQELIQKWIAKNKVEKIAELWVKGYEIDWEIFYREIKPQRISLPTYPFARESYWIPERNWLPENDLTLERVPASPAITSIHPLVHQNTSSLLEQRFSSTFTGREIFCRDYQVNGQRFLPGAAYLEMARAAVELAAGSIKDGKTLGLKNIIWDRPVSLNDESVKIHIEVYWEDDGTIAYQVYSGDDNRDQEPMVYNQGAVILNSVAKVPVLDLKSLQSQCDQTVLSGGEFYDRYKKMGIEYGPGFQGIETVYAGTGKILARLVLPSGIADTIGQFVLHPNILDFAMQAAGGFLRDEVILNESNAYLPSFPFAVKEIEIYNHCSSRMWALLQNCPEGKLEDAGLKLDIDLCDDLGNVCIRVSGLVYDGTPIRGSLSFAPEIPVIQTFTPSISGKPSGISLRGLSAGHFEFSKNQPAAPAACSELQFVPTEITEEIAPVAATAAGITQESLRKELVKSLADLLYLSQEEVDLDKKFVDIGLDSIIAVEWIRVVNKKYQTSITATMVYDYPSIREFSGFLERELNKSKQKSNIASIPATPRLLNPPNLSNKPALISLRRLSAQPVLAPLSIASNQRSIADPLLKPAFIQPPVKEGFKTKTAVFAGITQELIRNQLVKSLADLLYVKQEDVEIDKKFVDIGLDSIIAVEWVRMINRQYGTSITATMVYDYPSIREFSGFLEQELKKQGKESIASPPQSASPSSVDELLNQVYQGTIDVEQADQLLYQFL